MLLAAIDWAKMFEPAIPVLETILRGSLIYLFIVVFMRIILRRGTGNLTVTDVLMVVLIGDASQAGMAQGHESVTDAAILIATLLVWDWALSWLGYHIKPIGALLHPKPEPLVKDGRLNRRNMRKEMITEEELLTQARLNGVESIGQIKHAYIEGDGSITILQEEGSGGGGGGQEKAKKKVG